MKSISRITVVVGGLGALAIVVVLAGLLLVIQPQRAKADATGAKIAAAQRELASLHAGGTTHIPSIRAAELFQLSRAMPDGSDVPGIVLNLAQLADSSSVSLVSVKPSTPATLTNGATALPLSVTVDGNWSGVTRFLHNVRLQVRVRGSGLNVTGRLFDIDSIQLQPGAQGKGMEAVLSINAFSYGKPVPPAASPTTTSTTTTTTTTTTPASASEQAAGTTGTGS